MFKLIVLAMMGGVGTLMGPVPQASNPGSGFAILLEDGNKLTTEGGDVLRTE